MDSLIDEDVKIRVSSFLDKSAGKKFLVDGNPETCWTSQQGLPQWIHMTFPTGIIPKMILLTFQGGFVGTKCAIEVPNETHSDNPENVIAEQTKSKLRNLVYIYPEDVNRKQSFELPEVAQPVPQLRLVFESSSDFFGRITIYDLQILGTRLAGQKPVES